MTRRSAWALLVCLFCTIGFGARLHAAGTILIADRFDQPAENLTSEAREQYHEGRSLFRQVWTIAPAEDDQILAGLGPVYNGTSCIECHIRNGGSGSPASSDDKGGLSPRGALVRLSLPGRTDTGAPKPHPIYGDQLNDRAIPGVAPEGSFSLTFKEHSVTLPGGEIIWLRQPRLAFHDLAFGPLGRGILTSLRVAQPVFGSGLLAAIPDSAIAAEAAKQAEAHARGSAVQGRANHVWNIASHTTTIGRFGWKANQPTIEQQAAAAANNDMGLTSPLFPAKNCSIQQQDCARAFKGPQPEISAERMAALVAFLRNLDAPRRRDPNQPLIRQGAALFSEIGCAQCHRPGWTIPRPEDQTPAAAEANLRIEPYTDLLLHNMGAGLADGRPDFEAGPRDWRTPPLWGIGLAQAINPSIGFLHDGRARSLSEAILWHGGEADAARARFAQFSPAERHALLAFLNDL